MSERRKLPDCWTLYLKIQKLVVERFGVDTFLCDHSADLLPFDHEELHRLQEDFDRCAISIIQSLIQLDLLGEIERVGLLLVTYDENVSLLHTINVQTQADIEVSEILTHILLSEHLSRSSL